MLFKLVNPIPIKTNCNYDKYCNKKNWSARLNFKLPAAQSVYRKSYIKPPPRGGRGGLFIPSLLEAVWGGGLLETVSLFERGVY